MGLLPGGEKLGLLPSSVSNGEKKPPLLSHKLTGAEITAVRQLITGYRYTPRNIAIFQKKNEGKMLQNQYLMTMLMLLIRESAAFLLRSADELEHLLQIQPKL